MPSTLTMPKLSPTMEEGTIVKWHKKVGDSFQPGDLLMEIATDKATVEHQALDEGLLRKILVEEGQTARVNQPIAILTADSSESFEDYQPEGESAASQEPSVVEEKEEEEQKAKEEPVKGQIWQQPKFVPEPPLTKVQFAFASEKEGERIVASPLARKLAREKELDLTSVRGTGPNGRIMKRDLRMALPLPKGAHPKRAMPKDPPGSFEDVPLTPMRKVIGQRLQESKSFIPHFYVSLDVDSSALMEVKEQLKQGEIKISVNDLVVRAAALALKKHPNINAGFNSVTQSIIQFKTIDIAVAVSREGGLITPIVRHADFKNVGELASEVRYLAKKAREGKLEIEEYKGGSFTISNLGMYGITHFQAILNPPQAAILAVGGIRDVPVIKNQVIVPGKLMSLSLSVDHRVIDGVAASEFLNTLKILLENPSLLII